MSNELSFQKKAYRNTLKVAYILVLCATGPAFRGHTPTKTDSCEEGLDETCGGTENSRLLPQATIDAAEDLKLKKENQKPDTLPRSVSVVGENVSKDLKLKPEHVDPRNRTNSEGPSMGMEKRKL